VTLETDVQPRRIAVERVRVLHDELADAEQPAARPGLVALLRREVVPGLRELPVRLNLARVEGHRLLVRQREDERPTRVVLELEHLRDRDAARFLPQLGWCQDGAEHLLPADRVHLLADDLDDLLVHAPAEGQVAPEARADLADEAAAHEQPVRGRLGVGRRIAQRREEEL
jgi:hypothetical protein